VGGGLQVSLSSLLPFLPFFLPPQSIVHAITIISLLLPHLQLFSSALPSYRYFALRACLLGGPIHSPHTILIYLIR
jgi:hypothetical protein